MFSFNNKEHESGANASSIGPLAVWIDSISDTKIETNYFLYIVVGGGVVTAVSYTHLTLPTNREV